MRHGWKLLAVFLVGLALAPAVHAQTKLRYKFKEGDKLDYLIEQKQKMAMNIMGMDIDINVNMDIEMNWETTKVDDMGNAQVKVSIGRVKMKMESPTGNVDIDSKSAEEPDDQLGKILAPIVKGMAGIQMTFTMDPTGEMKDTKITESSIKKLKKGGLPGLDKFGDMLSPDTLKTMVSGSLVLPKEEISKGKTWRQKTNSKTPFGTVKGENEFTYVGPIEKGGEKFEKIAVKPEMKIEPDPDAKFQIKVKDGKGKGYILFDNTRGRIAESNNEMTMQMDLEVLGMTISQNVTQNTTMRLKGRK